MDFTITAEQQELLDLVQEIVTKEIAPRALEMDKDGVVPDELWKILKQTGLTSLGVPKEYGGIGLDAMTLALIFENRTRLRGYCDGVRGEYAGHAAGGFRWHTRADASFL